MRGSLPKISTSMLSWQFSRPPARGASLPKKSLAPGPDLERLIDQLRPGDVVIVTKYDRLSLSLHDLLGIVARIQAAGAGFLESE